MVAVFNTPDTHHMVVCTLCSCYPWPVLGLPPVWYKSAPYRSRAVSEPRAVLSEFGVSLAVIRLRYMVRAPRRRVAAVSRRAVFSRDDYRCQYCGNHADSIDHVVPRSRGGRDVWDNLAAACRPCNSRKRDRTPDEAGMRLLRPCHAPRPTAWIVVGGTLVPETWKPYLAIAS